MLTKQRLLVLALGCMAYCQLQAQSATLVLHGDSATAPASLRYQHPSFLKRLFLGKNYRTTWATPVTLPLFHLRAMGFTVKELGGGQQTKSLRLLDKEGHEWALRSIDKEVKAIALPKPLRNALLVGLIQDMVSGAQPYAPLTIPPMADAAGVVASHPRFFFVADDPDLGQYRELFKNAMCLLEEREPTPDHSETENTEKLLNGLLKNNDVQMDGEAVLRARLLDMLIADWDRHEDQWRWAYEKKGGRTVAYAIPRDRDQAYFYSQGLLVKFMQLVALKHLVGFTSSTKRVKSLSAKVWNFDRVFLNSLSAQDWSLVAHNFAAALPDSLIEAAVKKLPPEIYSINGAEITRKLISRRNSLPNDVMGYYNFLATDVSIVGTDAPERFVITRAKDSLTVQQFAGPGFTELVYQRTFYRAETYAVSIYGLGGDDVFVEQPGTRSRIHLVLDGGADADQYQLQNQHRTTVENSGLEAKSYLPVLKKMLRIKD